MVQYLLRPRGHFIYNDLHKKNTPETYCVKQRCPELIYFACNITLWTTNNWYLSCPFGSLSFFVRKHIHLSIILVKLQCLQFRYLTCSIAFSASKKLVLIVNFGLMLAPPRVTLLINSCMWNHISVLLWQTTMPIAKIVSM